MTRFLCVLMLIGCGGSEHPAEPPSLEILTPADGAVVSAGDVSVSMIVEHFEVGESEQARGPLRWRWSDLSPIPAAHAHGEEGTPRGTIVLRLDGAEVAEIADTVATLSDVGAGDHTLGAELIHEDGESLDPAVVVSVAFTAEAP